MATFMDNILSLYDRLESLDLKLNIWYVGAHADDRDYARNINWAVFAQFPRLKNITVTLGSFAQYMFPDPEYKIS